MKHFCIILFASFFMQVSMGQLNCPTNLRTANGALLICGNVTITEAAVNYTCYNRNLVVPNCATVTANGNPVYRDYNPFWYKFTCYQAGTFGFTITPADLTDDFNWQLYDITGLPANNVYNNPSYTKAANWSATPGLTGASAAGSSFVQCYSANGNPFSGMPAIIVGHNYLLMVSQGGSNGFTLSVGGGTASIQDPDEPHMVSVTASSCGGNPLTLIFNKKLKCERPQFGMAGINPSQFVITPPLATLTGVSGIDCSHSEQIDSVIFSLSNALPPGNYTISIQNPTTTDFCGRMLTDGESIPFTIDPVLNTVMDSIKPSPCATKELQLVFKQRVRCPSVAADGTDFVVSGPSPVTVLAASGINCSANPVFNNQTYMVRVVLSNIITVPGTYQITLKTGSDGNTLKDQCNADIPAATLSFEVKEPVDANFNYSIRVGCKADTIDYTHNGLHNVNSWQWDFDGLSNSSLQNPQTIYDPFGTRHTKLVVSNGGCIDSSEVDILLGNELKPAFEVSGTICPGEPALFKNTSSGDIISWLWEFGNGNTSILESPPRQYYAKPLLSTEVLAKLSVTNAMGCINTATQKIALPVNCDALVPGAFTPDGNGTNDYLYPVNVMNPTEFLFRVFNRYGETVFQTTDATKKWDGTYSGKKADAGTYLWILHFKDYAGRIIDEKGTTILLR